MILNEAPVLKPEPKPPGAQVPSHSSLLADTQPMPEHVYVSNGKFPKISKPRETVTVQRVTVTVFPVASAYLT